MSRSFFSAWIDAEPSARAFLEPVFQDPRARASAAESANKRVSDCIPADLAAVLRTQAELHPPSAARNRNLAAIVEKRAAVVVTGQQVGLFLGPLYTFYKAASAIAVARTIEAESGVPVVPIFWLQTEDHDFEEIDHCFVPSKDGELELRLRRDDLRVSVAQRRLGEDVRGCIEALAKALEETPYGDDVVALFRRWYTPGRSLSAAFAGVLGELFAAEGLVIFDPRDPSVARLSARIYARAIAEAESIGEELLERSRALKAAGFKTQVRIRKGSPLVFHHDGGATGPRTRLTARGEGFVRSGSGRIITRESLEHDLATDALRFSTSALLRPLVQDTLFPTVAYVGGPAEVTYFAQLAPLYARFGATMPMIVPRARFRMIDEKSAALLRKLNLSAADAERPRRELFALAGRNTTFGGLPSSEALRASLFGGLEENLERLRAAAVEVDRTLERPALKTKSAVSGALHKLFTKYDRALVERDRVLTQRIDRLRAALAPGGHPQERRTSVPWFLARSGVDEFKAKVFAQLAPFAGRVEDVFL